MCDTGSKEDHKQLTYKTTQRRPEISNPVGRRRGLTRSFSRLITIPPRRAEISPAGKQVQRGGSQRASNLDHGRESDAQYNTTCYNISKFSAI